MAQFVSHLLLPQCPSKSECVCTESLQVSQLKGGVQRKEGGRAHSNFRYRRAALTHIMWTKESETGRERQHRCQPGAGAEARSPTQAQGPAIDNEKGHFKSSSIWGGKGVWAKIRERRLNSDTREGLQQAACGPTAERKSKKTKDMIQAI